MKKNMSPRREGDRRRTLTKTEPKRMGRSYAGTSKGQVRGKVNGISSSPDQKHLRFRVTRFLK